MQNIIFSHPVNDYTGSTRVLNQIIEDQSQNTDRKIKVICEDSGSGFLSDNPNVEIIRIPHKRIKNNNLLNKFLNSLVYTPLWIINLFFITLKNIKSYDHVYINTIVPFSSAIAARLMRKKVTYHIHEKFTKKHFTIKIGEFIFSHIKSKRIYVSEYTKNQYKRKSNCEEIIKYNTLPKLFINRIIKNDPQKRLRNNILMLSSLNKAKGIYTYIDLAKINPALNFTLVLSASQEKIENQIKGIIPDNLKILPAQTDTNKFYQNTDLVLNLSIPNLWIETFGLTIIEAFAYGIPVIAPNYGGPKEIVKNYQNGILLNDPTDLTEISNAMSNILRDKQTYLKFSQSALASGKDFCV